MAAPLRRFRGISPLAPASLLAASSANQTHWSGHWQRSAASGDLTPWDSNMPSSVLVEVLDSGDVPGPSRAASAVELGCGSGASTVHMAEAGYGEVFGIDYAEEALLVCRPSSLTTIASTSLGRCWP